MKQTHQLVSTKRDNYMEFVPADNSKKRIITDEIRRSKRAFYR